ncbi:MAG TPA: ABC transporter permease [Saprospiraceae bacterium]|nr:ABC transporter permease [Saprospiraceae bacterium]
MLFNYLKVAIRNLTKNPVISGINFTGLALGLACCLLLVLYTQHETSYDQFHTRADRIVRVIMKYTIGGSGSEGNFTSTKVLPEFQRKFPEVVSGVRFSSSSALITKDETASEETGFLFVDSSFFNVFDFNLVNGNPDFVLNEPNSLVLTERIARKYFGEEDPIGESLFIGSAQTPYKITGICADSPPNSQIQFNLLASITSIGPLQETTYSDANYTTYLLLDENINLPEFQKKVDAFMESENEDSDFKVYFTLEPFTKIHLHSPYDALVPNISIRYIYIVLAVALLILIIACFTYINLSTARSIERAREVGIRKVAGAAKGNVFWQFIAESLLLTVLSLGLGLILMYYMIPYFNKLAQSHLEFRQIFQPQIVSVVLLLTGLIAFLAGSYPAMMLAGFHPVKILKGAFKNTGSGTTLRKSLIVFQFAISGFLIISTLIIKAQLDYIQEKELGYNKENILMLPADPIIRGRMDMIKSELLSVHHVKGVSLAYESPVNIKGGYNMSGLDISQSMAVTANPIDEAYIEVMELELISGQNITTEEVKRAMQEDYTQNYFHFILNELAAQALGWTPEEAVGQKMYLDESRPGEVKGVVKNFHFKSLHSEIKPLVLFPGGWWGKIFIKVNGEDIQNTISALDKKWKEIIPHRPFSYRFVDEEYQIMYDTEVRMSKVFNIFSLLAVLLASLGLFGLSSFTAKQREKEMGVRKVLGASIFQTSILLASGFLRLVFFSCLIAFPIAWFVMLKWLQQFTYRVSIDWQIFVWAVIISISVAFLTVLYQCLKISFINPVHSLKNE